IQTIAAIGLIDAISRRIVSGATAVPRPWRMPMATTRPAPSAPTGSADQPRAFWLAWASTLLFFAGFYALLVPLPRYLSGIGLPDWQVGLILGAFGVASVLGRPVAGIGVDRFGARP